MQIKETDREKDRGSQQTEQTDRAKNIKVDRRGGPWGQTKATEMWRQTGVTE
jgi:hypothetical protein